MLWVGLCIGFLIGSIGALPFIVAIIENKLDHKMRELDYRVDRQIQDLHEVAKTLKNGHRVLATLEGRTLKRLQAEGKKIPMLPPKTKAKMKRKTT